MAQIDEFVRLMLGVVGLGVCAVSVAGLLRGAGSPGGSAGAGIIAGLMVGVLLGATVLGRAAPGFFARVFVGAEAERLALAALEARHAAEIATLREIGVTGVAIEEHDAAFDIDAAPARAALEDARRHQTQRVGLVVAVLGGMWLTLGVIGSVRAGRARSAVSGHASIVAAGSCVTIAGGAVFLLIRWTTNASVTEAAAFAASLAVGGAVFDRVVGTGAQRRRDRSLDAAARLSLVVPAWALLALAPSPGSAVFAGSAAIAAAMPRRARASRGVRRVCRVAALGALLPAIVALVAARIDFIAVAGVGTFWIALLIALLLAADGRWFGAWIGWNAAGRDHDRRWAWSRSAAMLAAGVGVSQIVLAGVASASGTLPDPLLAAAVLSAPTIELTRPLRIRLAAALDAGGTLTRAGP